MGLAVHQIEAQNKGIQTVTNNQKALFNELDVFIHSLKVPAFVLEILANEGLDTADGVKECQTALDRVMSIIGYKNDDLMEMQAVKERISFFQGHVNQFSFRLSTYLTTFFQGQV